MQTAHFCELGINAKTITGKRLLKYGLFLSLPSFHLEPELKESLQFIGTISLAHVAIAGAKTHELLLNYHQILLFSEGNRYRYVLWKAIPLLSCHWD
jgi:hypothetical protein